MTPGLCPTCGGRWNPADDTPPPPATSSAWARRQAIEAAAEAVRIAREKRTTKTEESK